MQIDQTLMQSLLRQAASSPRLRAFLNLHQSFSEPVQRVLIAMLGQSYVVPHQHPNVGQFELFLVLQGSLDLLQFDASGTIVSRQRLGSGQQQVGAELTPGVWHTLVAHGDGAVFLEIKAGPFDPAAPRCFADFAPAEQSAWAKDYQQWLQHAQVGERFEIEHTALELDS
jgi:cupin fold WbuC family metalloprotein